MEFEFFPDLPGNSNYNADEPDPCIDPSNDRDPGTWFDGEEFPEIEKEIFDLSWIQIKHIKPRIVTDIKVDEE